MTKIIRLKQVIDLTGLSRSSIYSYLKEGAFPKQINLGPRSVGWVSEEIENWLNEKISGRDKDAV